jgi:hypothetical protein
MSKEYYTKAEVNKLLADQKEEILAILSKPSKKELNSFELKMYGGRIMRLQVIDIIFHELSNNKLIDVVSKKVFRDAFLGNDIKKETKKSLINWKGPRNLCVYLIDSLADFDLIIKEELNLKCEHIFGVKNAAQIKVKYRKNKNKLPGNYEIIDEIRHKITSIYNNIDQDEEYFKNEILPELI